MIKRFVPWIVCGVFLLYLAASAVSRPLQPGSRFDIARFARLPVSLAGRVQPFDSVAQVALSRIRGSAFVPVSLAKQSHGGVLDANEWLLEVLAKPDAADARKIFPIAEPKLIEKLSLKPPPSPASEGDPAEARPRRSPFESKRTEAGAASRPAYYAFQELAAKGTEIGKETKRIAGQKPEQRAPWERELLGLQMQLSTYERLKNSVQPNSLLQLQAKGRPVVFNFAQELNKFRVDMQEAVRIARRRKNGSTERLDAPTEQRIRTFAGLFQGVSRLSVLAAVPPAGANPRAPWTNTGTAIVDCARGGRLSPSIAYVAGIVSTFAAGDAAGFNERVTKYERWLASNGLSAQVRQAGYETFYNVFQPFVRAVFAYGVGLVLLVAAWRTRSKAAYRSALMLVGLGLALHAMGLAFALTLGGQPGFATFAGWAVALIALVAGWFRRSHAGTATAAVTGFVVLMLAFVFTAGGAASLARNVLDIRFLAALVLTAGAIGLAAIVRRSRTTNSGQIRSYANYHVSRRSVPTQ